MVHHWDKEVGEAVTPMLAAAAQAPKIPAGDALGRRAVFEPMLSHILASVPWPQGVKTKDFATKASDGHEILLRWFYKDDSPVSPTSALLHTHGGGMILGNVDMFGTAIATNVSATGVPVLSVEYRLAPEHPHPIPVEDSYAGLLWLQEHAKELNVDPKRIGVTGESAGGGLAAGVALLARDRKFDPPLAKQILVYPMLDDRNTKVDENVAPFMFWTFDDNITGWSALLGKEAGGKDVPYYAAPARAPDMSGLPPTYIDVGQLDIFFYENMEYVKRLSQAGVDVEFHLHPGVCHAFEALAPKSDIVRRVTEDRLRAIKGF